jgi:hypothetical protein
MLPNEIKRRFPNASPAFVAANAESAGTPAVVERAACDATLAARETKGRHSGRYLVRVESVRSRLLDEDNLCAKYHVDCLRYAGILPSDAPGVAKIEVTQRRCLKGEAEKVVIRVWKL